MARLQEHEIQIGKLHISSALKLRARKESLRSLGDFADNTYLHQVVVRGAAEGLVRHKDLGDAFRWAKARSPEEVHQTEEEWRVHFHIPLHCPAGAWFETTTDHALGVLDCLRANPALCRHLEMETYTWEVMPAPLKSRDVVEQLTAEYAWCLGELRARGLANGASPETAHALQHASGVTKSRCASPNPRLRRSVAVPGSTRALACGARRLAEHIFFSSY